MGVANRPSSTILCLLSMLRPSEFSASKLSGAKPFFRVVPPAARQGDFQPTFRQSSSTQTSDTGRSMLVNADVAMRGADRAEVIQHRRDRMNVPRPDCCSVAKFRRKSWAVIHWCVSLFNSTRALLVPAARGLVVARLVALEGVGYTHPRAAMLVWERPPITRWSRILMSSSASACFNRTVIVRSAALGSGFPDG